MPIGVSVKFVHNSSYKSDTSYHTAPKWMHDLFCACLPCVLLFLLTLAAQHHTHSSFYLQNTSYLSHKRCEFHFNHIFVVYARSCTATKYQIMKWKDIKDISTVEVTLVVSKSDSALFLKLSMTWFQLHKVLKSFYCQLVIWSWQF